MKKVSKFQSSFKDKLVLAMKQFGYSVLSEDLDFGKKFRLKINDKQYHIPDFFIPEINLFIELSGNNYTAKLLKMKRAHKLKDINYFAIPCIANKELELPSDDEQLETLVFLLKSGVSILEISKYSENQLDEFVDKFIKLYKE